MAKYKIEWSELKTGKSGKQYSVMSLTDTATGAKHENVSIFDPVITGASIEGEIVQNGNYLNFKPKQASTGHSGASGGIKKAQEFKVESINKSMDRKENAIELSSTFRDATAICVALYGNTLGEYEFKLKWLEWRAWLLSKFGDSSDITETKEPF